jgi:hypothetical protein
MMRTIRFRFQTVELGQDLTLVKSGCRPNAKREHLDRARTSTSDVPRSRSAFDFLPGADHVICTPRELAASRSRARAPWLRRGGTYAVQPPVGGNTADQRADDLSSDGALDFVRMSIRLDCYLRRMSPALFIPHSPPSASSSLPRLWAACGAIHVRAAFPPPRASLTLHLPPPAFGYTFMPYTPGTAVPLPSPRFPSSAPPPGPPARRHWPLFLCLPSPTPPRPHPRLPTPDVHSRRYVIATSHRDQGRPIVMYERECVFRSSPSTQPHCSRHARQANRRTHRRGESSRAEGLSCSALVICADSTGARHREASR